MSYSPGKDRNFIASLKRTMDKLWFGIDVSGRAQYPNCLSGEYLISGNNAQSGTVGLVGSDASDQVNYPLQVGIPITSAQLLALNTTPVTLIPAPGAGFAIFVETLVLEMIKGTAAYTAANTTSLVYHGQTTAISQPFLGSVFTGTSATTLTAAAGGHVTTNGVTLLANTAVDLYTQTANYSAGNGTAKVYVTYSIVTL